MNELIDKQTNKQVNLKFLYSQRVRRTIYWFYESEMFCTFKELEGCQFTIDNRKVICVAAYKLITKNVVQFTFVEFDPKRWPLQIQTRDFNCKCKKKWYQIFVWDKELHRNIYGNA